MRRLDVYGYMVFKSRVQCISFNTTTILIYTTVESYNVRIVSKITAYCHTLGMKLYEYIKNIITY